MIPNLVKRYLKPDVRKLAALWVFTVFALMLFNTAHLNTGSRANSVNRDFGYPLSYVRYAAYSIGDNWKCDNWEYYQVGILGKDGRLTHVDVCMEYAAHYEPDKLALDLIFWYLVAALAVEACNIPCALAARKKEKNKPKAKPGKKSK